jgi:two-component sensor histidine kinase
MLIRFEGKGEQPLWLSTTKAPIRDENGKITGLVAIARDVSSRKYKEEHIRAALNEREILLGEIHHRVKNNLQIVHSLLDLQFDRIADPVVLDMLRASQQRVRSMALIHQSLYESKDFAQVDFASFLDALVPPLLSSYGVDPECITLSINATEVLLPIAAAIPCGLLVNELLANALKHAFPQGRSGEIRIDLTHEEDDNVALSVSDDGVGIPEDLDLGEGGALGLHLVKLLTDQLGAVMTLQRSKPTRFVLRFPIRR